jgi:hypothetical protein
MKTGKITTALCRWIAVILWLVAMLSSAHADDPLKSWQEGPAKSAIIDFVGKVTKTGDASFVAPVDRIAVFDNDGTLWCEQPLYVQLAFVLDRLKTLAPSHPDWRQKEPFKSALEGNLKAVAAGGEGALAQLLAATHAGMSTDAFSKIVTDWLATARHPKFHRPYTELVYQPMLELLAYLRANGFRTYIASGGGVDFMRPWAERVYGIPPDQVIGSSIKLSYELINGTPTLMRDAAIDFIDDKQGKPIGIYKALGKKPIAAFGNSDGDFQMLDWVTSGPGARLGMIVHHTDDIREYAYDRKSSMGRLDKALDAAPSHHWILINMKQDWKEVFADPTPSIK